ncbi:hypothetical protein ACP70R_008550 [Stipagrostis hirtigluma subsp. patula]
MRWSPNASLIGFRLLSPLSSSFFQGSKEIRGAMYNLFIPIAVMARSYYADATVLEGITDDEFVSMMFVDGCSLVQFMITMLGAEREAFLLQNKIQPHRLGIIRDIMLLENQISWIVVEFFMALKQPFPMQQLISFLTFRYHVSVSEQFFAVRINENHVPLHLLSLVRFYLVGINDRGMGAPVSNLQLTTSAAELAEMGIKLKATKTTQYSDVDIVKSCFFAKLSLPPLPLDSLNACALVNMAAYEICRGGPYDVNSYLCILGMLMNKEEDVRELRTKRIVGGLFGDNQTLEFFKDQAPKLMTGPTYVRIIFDLSAYRHKRRVWIAIYRFFYKNAKTIAMVLPIIGVLVGIFEALYSVKQKQH